MIIANGVILPMIKVEGGIDPNTRYPVEGEREWGAPIPCQFVPTTINKQAIVSGEGEVHKCFTIYIEERSFEYEQIQLRDDGGRNMGEYSIMSSEYLVAVCQLKLTVEQYAD